VAPDADEDSSATIFHPLMREIVAESRVSARLHKHIMFALSSKYSLALYEMLQKHGNMTHTYEEMTVDEFRSFLGVPARKLKAGGFKVGGPSKGAQFPTLNDVPRIYALYGTFDHAVGNLQDC
jgi:hypothetical protein